MGMLFGSYEHSLDQKNRLRIPARLKQELGSDAVIVKGRDGCLYIYPSETKTRLAEKLNEVNLTPKELKGLRLFLASMYPIDEDNQGRFTLNSSLKQYANINKDLLFVGLNNRIEVWAKEMWETTQANDVDMSELLEDLSQFGI